RPPRAPPPRRQGLLPERRRAKRGGGKGRRSLVCASVELVSAGPVKHAPVARRPAHAFIPGSSALGKRGNVETVPHPRVSARPCEDASRSQIWLMSSCVSIFKRNFDGANIRVFMQPKSRLESQGGAVAASVLDCA